MDKVYEMYRSITGKSGTPPIMEISHASGSPALDEFLIEHFGEPLEAVLQGPDPVDAFLEIDIKAREVGCHVLIVNHDHGSGVSRYLEVKHIRDPEIQKELRAYAARGETHLHFHGPNLAQALEDLRPYVRQQRNPVPPHETSEIYSDRGYLCRDVTLKNKLGLHARPAAAVASLFCDGSYPGIQAYVRKDDLDADTNARSIMALLTLAAPKDTKLSLRTCGPQASEVLEKMYAVFQQINDGKYGD